MSRTRGQAFTLIEVLLVMTIIALVVALLLPSLGLAKESSRNVQCMNQERQINLATITYTYDFNYNFPACVGQEVIIERTSLGGTVHQVSERWPARLLPYLGTTDIFRCPVQFITLPVNTYYANTLSWTGNGQCVRPGSFLPESTNLDDVVNPSRVVTYFESTHDRLSRTRTPIGSGAYLWMVPSDIKWWGDYCGNFQYKIPPIGGSSASTGGRHFRTPSRVGGDPWGKDNVALADGQIRTLVSMQYLVDNEPLGVYHSYPFLPENEWAKYDFNSLERGTPDVGVEFWTVPWW